MPPKSVWTHQSVWSFRFNLQRYTQTRLHTDHLVKVNE